MTDKQYADCWKILRGQAKPSLLETMNAIEHLVEIGMIENEKCDYSKCNEKAEIKGYIYREENGRKTEDTYDVQVCKEHASHPDFHPKQPVSLYPEVMKD